MESSILSPAERVVPADMIEFIAITAACEVPPPRDIIIFPEGVDIGKSMPIAAARGCCINNTSLLPAPNPASCTARLSTPVTP